MIDKRKRMLQSFLNRIARHPVMGGNHVFHQFLTESNWNDVLSQSGYAHLLKKKKNAIQKAMEKQTPKMPGRNFNSNCLCIRSSALTNWINSLSHL